MAENWMPEEPKGLSARDKRKWKKRWTDPKGDVPKEAPAVPKDKWKSAWDEYKGASAGSTADRVIGMMKQGYAKQGRGIASIDKRSEVEEYEKMIEMDRAAGYDVDPGMEREIAKLEGREPSAQVARPQVAPRPTSAPTHAGGGDPHAQAGPTFEGPRMPQEEFDKLEAAQSAKTGAPTMLQERMKKAKLKRELAR